jgi:ABC-type multidrug transport system fused ATPase/permease subunit
LLFGFITSARRSRGHVAPGSIRRIFRHFGPHLRPYRAKLAAAALFMIGATTMELLRPWPLKLIFDGILLPTASARELLAHVPALAAHPERLLIAIALAVLAIAIAGGLFRYGQAYLTASAGQKVIAAIRVQLYSHIQRLSQSFHDTKSSGDLMTRLTGDINLMRDLMVNTFIQLSDSLLLIIGMIGVMLWMDWQLTLVALAVIPALMLTTGKFSRELKGATRKQRRREGKIADILAETISTAKVIQAFGRENHEESRFSRESGSTLKAGIVATRLEYRLNLVVQTIIGVGTALVFWFGVQRVQSGVLTPGDLLVFGAYLTTLYKPIRKLASFSGRIAKATACGERVVDTLEIEPEIRDAPDAVQAPRFGGEIVFDAVAFGYRDGDPVLRDFDLRIAPGEKIAVVGESGSGKSTVVNLLLRFYDPTAGAVRIDGEDIRRYTLASLRRQIAVVLQESVLFNTTIRDNIAYGRLDASQEEIERAAKAANIHGFIESLPEGYDTIVGERGALLSGGQRQRIAIARAMIQEARIIVLDEPMTGLDPDSEAKIQQAMDRLTKGKTCLLITHDLRAASAADRTLRIRQGRITPTVGYARTDAGAA